MSSSGDPRLPQAGKLRSDFRDHASPSGWERPRAGGSARHEDLQGYWQSGLFDAGRRIYGPRSARPSTDPTIPAGVGRQFAAIVANGSRIKMLKKLSVPTLVLHGADDPLVPVEAGRHTAAPDFGGDHDGYSRNGP